MKFRLHSFLMLILLFIPIAIFFYPVWGQGKLPLPADTIPGLYHPMRDALKSEYPNGPPYKNFLITDAVRQQYPWRQFAVSELKSGRIPWWNPYNFSGTPHLANFQSAVFYPLNIIFWLVDFPTGWTILVISQQVLGALFLYLYLKSRSLKPIACVFGALTWIFSGFFVAWLEWNTAGHVAMWTPLILLAIDRLVRKTSQPPHQISWLIILFFSLSAQFLAGYPQPWVYLTLLQSVYLIWRINQQRLVKQAVKIGVIYLLFMITISVQLLTSYEFSRFSNRLSDQGNVLEKTDWFLPYQNLVQLIIPDFFGNPATLNYWGVFNYTEFVGYIGVIPLACILTLLLAKKPSKETLFFGFFVVLSLVLATKNPISQLQFNWHIPFLDSSQPSRWLVVTNLTLAILAAIGLDSQLQRRPAYKSALVTILILSIIFGFSWFITLQPTIFSLSPLMANLAVTQRNLILPTLEFILGCLITGGCYFFCHSRFSFKLLNFIPGFLRQKQTYALIIISLSTLTSLRFAAKFTPFSDRKFLYPGSQIVSYLQQHAGLNRYLTTDRRLMAPNFNLTYGLYTIEGYDPLYLKTYGQLIYASESNSWPASSKPFNRIVTTDNFSSPIVNLLGVKYILSFTSLTDPQLKPIMTEGETYLYENLNSFPRAFVAPADFGPFHPQRIEPAVITNYQPLQVSVRLDGDSGGLLILSDSFYPGWEAEIDGRATPITNWYGLRAVTVTAADREVVFKYRPSIISQLSRL